jgi:hypothetical protein
MLNSVALERYYVKYHLELEDYYKKKLSETLNEAEKEPSHPLNLIKPIELSQFQADFLFPRPDYKSSLVRDNNNIRISHSLGSAKTILVKSMRHGLVGSQLSKRKKKKSGWKTRTSISKQKGQ